MFSSNGFLISQFIGEFGIMREIPQMYKSVAAAQQINSVHSQTPKS